MEGEWYGGERGWRGREVIGRGGGGVDGHTQHFINVEDINKEKHTYTSC